MERCGSSPSASCNRILFFSVAGNFAIHWARSFFAGLEATSAGPAFAAALSNLSSIRKNSARLFKDAERRCRPGGAGGPTSLASRMPFCAAASQPR